MTAIPSGFNGRAARAGLSFRKQARNKLLSASFFAIYELKQLKQEFSISCIMSLTVSNRKSVGPDGHELFLSVSLAASMFLLLFQTCGRYNSASVLAGS